MLLSDLNGRHNIGILSAYAHENNIERAVFKRAQCQTCVVFNPLNTTTYLKRVGELAINKASTWVVYR